MFFFKAEDGIRACHVTGVQTCALPFLIYISSLNRTYVELRLCSVDCIGVYSVTLNRTYVELRHFIHGFNSCIIRALNRTYVELRPMNAVVCTPFRCLSIVPMWN